MKARKERAGAQTDHWFDVDRKGLAALVSRRGKAWLVIELLSNAWDEQVTLVTVTLEATGRGLARLVVDDDDPDGFVDLTHAYTLFADTAKRRDATVRGRFNLGEKLVLSVCKTALVESTTGSVAFDETGRHTSTFKRVAGSRFEAEIRMTKAEIAHTEALIHQLIPPPGVTTTFNGTPLTPRHPIHEFEATLETELQDPETGNVRRTARKTLISIYDPLAGEVASIYELGIPVVDTDDRWHVDIGQKVPLNIDRDNVTPAYLRKLRTLVLNEMRDRITTEDATSQWVKSALSDPDVSPDAVTTALELRYGPKRVAYDPSDPEANKIAASQGYTVVHGGAHSKPEWENIRRADALPPAGKVTPSPSSLIEHTNDLPIPMDEWTPGMHHIAAYVKGLAPLLIGCDVDVQFMAAGEGWLAMYGGRRVQFNVRNLGQQWFDQGITAEVDELVLHELGHHFGGHLDSSYHDALCKMGALLRRIPIR